MSVHVKFQHQVFYFLIFKFFLRFLESSSLWFLQNQNYKFQKKFSSLLHLHFIDLYFCFKLLLFCHYFIFVHFRLEGNHFCRNTPYYIDIIDSIFKQNSQHSHQYHSMGHIIYHEIIGTLYWVSQKKVWCSKLTIFYEWCNISV